jgi:hypothetical protein
MSVDVVVRTCFIWVLCAVVAGCERTKAVPHASQPEVGITSTKPLLKLGVAVGGAEFVLNESTLSEVQMTLLGGSVAEDRTTTESQSALCYWFASNHTQQLVQFLSDAEFGGRDKVLTGIEARLVLPGQQPPTGCLVITSIAPPARLFGGIWLGSSSAEIAAIFGISDPPDGHQAFRDQSKKSLPTQRESLDVTRKIDFDLINAQIVSLSLREIVSN